MKMVRVLMGIGAMMMATQALADAAPLAVKPGLWQVTVQGGISGLPTLPPSVLKVLKPEDRAKAEAAIAGANGPHTFRECLSAEDLRKGLDWTDNDGRACTRTVTESSASALTVEVDCKTHHAETKGTVHFDVASSERLNGTTDLTVTTHHTTLAVTGSIEGQWLGTDCGALRHHGTN